MAKHVRPPHAVSLDLCMETWNPSSHTAVASSHTAVASSPILDRPHVVLSHTHMGSRKKHSTFMYN